jgi:hypothetical protein
MRIEAPIGLHNATAVVRLASRIIRERFRLHEHWRFASAVADEQGVCARLLYKSATTRRSVGAFIFNDSCS